MEEIIKVEGVYKAYGKHQVHKGLDLGIQKGECFTLLGPSGCGKTVLIRMIAGHEVPDDGRIIIDNTVVIEVIIPKFIFVLNELNISTVIKTSNAPSLTFIPIKNSTIDIFLICLLFFSLFQVFLKLNLGKFFSSFGININESII